MGRRAAGALLALVACIACSAAAPTTSDQTALDTYDGAEGCYYNFQHYGEGDRIMTNEPCLNCTCHNRMLMCYLRVCPFTKAIGQDCTVEKRADQCCPIVTCPDVPVDLLTSTSTNSPAEYGSTGLGKQDKYGCSIDGKYFPEGAKVPPMPNKPCEHCYCIRNMTTCVMQECTLHVDGCTPIYHKDVCCPVRYSCDHPEDEIPLLDDMTTTVRPTPGFLLTTTTIAPVTQQSQYCVHDDEIIPDGALIKTDKACQHCYCMKGDMVCVVQDCGVPMENEGKNCTSLPPRDGECCPDTYICEGDELATEIPSELETGSPLEELTTLVPPRRVIVEGSGYRNEPDELPYTEIPTFATEIEGSGDEQPHPPSIDLSSTNVPKEEVSPVIDEFRTTTATEDKQDLDKTTTPRTAFNDDLTTSYPSLDQGLRTTLPPIEESEKTTKIPLLEDEFRTTLSDIVTKEPKLEEEIKTTESSLLESDSTKTQSTEDIERRTTMSPKLENDKMTTISSEDFETTPSSVSNNEIGATISQTLEDEQITTVLPVFENDVITTAEPVLDENKKTTALPILEDNLQTTTEADKGENTIPDETLEEHPSDIAEPFKTTISETSKTTIPSIYEEPVTTQKSEVTTAFIEENVTTERIEQQENEASVFTTIASVVSQESFTTESSIKDINLSTDEDTKQTTSSPVDTSKQEKSTQFSESTTESISTVSSLVDKDSSENLYPNVESTTLAADKHEEPESTTFLAPNDIARIPGEGDCLVDGITYQNYTIVPSINKCQTGCRCVSSIIKCDPILCSPPPQDMENMNDCQPIYDSPDSCCPTYVCDNMKETIPPQPHSQMSGTESSVTSKPVDECIGEECHENQAPSDQDPNRPKPDDCISGSCLNDNIVPVHSSDHPCEGDNCVKEPEITQSKDEPSTCSKEDDCKQEPADIKPSCEGESCQQEPSQFKPICEGDDCKQEPVSDKPACEGDDCKQESIDVKPACEGDDCKQVPINVIPACEGENCKQEPIDVKPACEEDNCKQEPIDVEPACKGEDCKQEPMDSKPACEGDDCKQVPINVIPACEGEDCKQEPIDVKPACEEDNCKQEPIDVEPACKGEDCKQEPMDATPACKGTDCKQEPIDVKPACEGEDCKQEPIDAKPACVGEGCKQEPIDVKPACEGEDCKQEPIDAKPACEGENCKPEPTDVKPVCEGDDCKQEPIDVEPACKGEDCKQEPMDATPACEGTDCKQEPIYVKPACEGEDCKQEPIDAKPDCVGEGCKQEPINVKPACEGEDCKQEPIDVEPACEGENCKQEPIDVKPTCEGEDCKHTPIDVKPVCEGEDCKQEPVDAKPSCEGEDCKQVHPIDIKPTCEGDNCQQESVDIKPMCNGENCKDKPLEDKPLCEGVSCSDAKADCDHNNCDSSSLPVDQTQIVACDSETGCTKPNEDGDNCEGETCRRKETSDLDTQITPKSTESTTDSDSLVTDKPVSHQPSLVTEKDTLFGQDATEVVNAGTEQPKLPTTTAEGIHTPLIETSTSVSESLDSANTVESQYSSELPQAHDLATQSVTTVSSYDLATDKQQVDTSTPSFAETEIAVGADSDSSTPSALENQTSKETNAITEVNPGLITVDDNIITSTQSSTTTYQDKLLSTQPEETNTQFSVESATESPETDNMQVITTTPTISIDQTEIQTEQPEQDDSKKPDTRTPQENNEHVSVTEPTPTDDTNKLLESVTTSATPIASDESTVEPQTVESQDSSTARPKHDDETTEETNEPSVHKEIVQTTHSIEDERLKPTTESSVSETKLPESPEPSETTSELPKENVDEITTDVPAVQTESPTTIYSDGQQQPITEKVELQSTISPDSNIAVTESEQIPESPVTELNTAITQQPISDVKTSEQTQKEEPLTELPIATEKDNNMYTTPLYTDVITVGTETMAPSDNKDSEKENEQPEVVTESNLNTEAPSASEQPLTTNQENVNKAPVITSTEATYQDQRTEESSTPIVRDESVTVVPDHVTDVNKLDDDKKSVTTVAPDYAQNTDSTKAQSDEIITETPLDMTDEITVTKETAELFTEKPTTDDLSNIPEHITLNPLTDNSEEPTSVDGTIKSTESSVSSTDAIESSTDASAVSPTEKQELPVQETIKPIIDEISTPVITENVHSATEPTMEVNRPESVTEEISVATKLPEALYTQKESNTESPETQEITTQSDNIQKQTSTEQPIMLVTEAESKPTIESEPSMSLVTKEPTDILMTTLNPSEEIVTEEPFGKVTESQDSKYTNIAPSDSEPDQSVTKEPDSTRDQQMSITEIPHDLVYDETPSSVDFNKPVADELTTKLPEEQGHTTEFKQEFSETTPYFVELDVHTDKIIEETSTYLPVNNEVTTERDINKQPSEPEITTEPTKDEEKYTEMPMQEESKPVDDKQQVTETSLPTESSTSPDVYQTSSSVPELIIPEQIATESPNTEELDTRYGDKDNDKEEVAPTQSVEIQFETTVSSIYKETEKPSVTNDSVISQADKNISDSSPHPDTASPEEEFIAETTKATTTKLEEELATSPTPSDEKITKPDEKETEHISSAAPDVPEPGPNEIQPTDETLSPDEEFPPSGTSGYGQETDYDDQVFGPGTCRYGGKVYVSAQQIPRDDPCDFCFCFRSDIICLQQSCPPPIHGCREEPIQGFCCPRYECPVSMATTLNVTTTTTTTTTTLPPHFLPHAYKGAAQRRGCQIKGHTYKVGEVVRASSGPCLHCTCGGDGQMKCDPKACTPEPMLRQMIAAAVSSKRRR